MYDFLNLSTFDLKTFLFFPRTIARPAVAGFINFVTFCIFISKAVLLVALGW